MAELAPLCGRDGICAPDDVDAAFTTASLLRRLPAILGEILSRNASLPSETRAHISALRSSIAADEQVGEDLIEFAKQQNNGWKEALSKVKWTDLSWFAAENLAFAAVARAVGPTDVFQSQKDEALASAAVAALQIIAAVSECSPASKRQDAALRFALWGNRADLSLTGGRAYEHAAHGSPEADCTDRLLADDSAAAVALLSAEAGGSRHVVLVLDNCGLELLCDLVLADVLLSSGAASKVTLLAKAQPVFVSDAMPKDVRAHVAALRSMADEAAGRGDEKQAAATAEMHSRLDTMLSSGSLAIEHHEFFHGPRAFWDMPADLRRMMASATLVISKGDANYRRLLGDRHWPHSTPFAEAVSYFPSALLALRTCKSGIAVGLAPEVEAAARAKDVDFLLTGRYGVIQLKI